MSDHHQPNDPWQLISAHQYEEAVAAYDAQLATGDEWYAANRVIALLCLGRLSEALEDISNENDVARQGRSSPRNDGHRTLAHGPSERC